MGEEIGTNPNNVVTLYTKALALNKSGNYQEAIKLCDKILKIDANNINALWNKGFALYKLGRSQEEIDCYDKILSIDPNHVDALSDKGLALENLGNYHKAMEFYDKALKIDPNHVNALTNKGRALRILGNNQEALKLHDKALKNNPNHFVALYNKALALQSLGDYQGAKKFYDKVLEIDPKYVPALFNRGKIRDQYTENQPVLTANQPVLTEVQRLLKLPIERLAIEDESAYLEFKSSLRWSINENKISEFVEHSAIKEIPAFLNAQGGVLIIGINPQGAIIGLSADLTSFGVSPTWDTWQQHLTSLIHDRYKISAPFDRYIHIHKETHNDSIVAIIEIDPSDSMVWMTIEEKGITGRGKKEKPVFYARRKNKTVMLDGIELANYLADRFFKNK